MLRERERLSVHEQDIWISYGGESIFPYVVMYVFSLSAL